MALHCGHDVGVLPESGCADPAERGDLPAPTLECVLKRESPDGGWFGALPWSLSIALLKQHILLESATCRENSDGAEMVP